MTRELEEKLARSLAADTTEVLPFVPYMLQDVWELGGNSGDMIKLIRKYMPISEEAKILELGCGKGAVSINIAKSLNINVYGFDLIPDFIEYAKQKAEELNVSLLCHFMLCDINEVVDTEKNYDCVILGGAGDALGNPQESLNKLLKTIKPQGYILIDEAYLRDSSSIDELEYKNYEYLTRKQWLCLFKDSGLKLLEEVPNIEEFDYDLKAVAARADELTAKYPEKRAIFEGYVQSLLNDCIDLKNNTLAVTWMLQRL